MDTPGLVFVCIIFLIMLVIAAFCCLKSCSSESPYNGKLFSKNKDSASPQPTCNAESQNETTSVSANSKKTLPSDTNTVQQSSSSSSQTHYNNNILSAQLPATDFKPSQNNSTTSVNPINTLPCPLKASSINQTHSLPNETCKSLDEIIIEVETKSKTSQAPSPNLTRRIKTEKNAPNSPESKTSTLLKQSSSLKTTPPSCVRKIMRYSSEPRLPPPPSYAEAMAYRRSWMEPQLSRDEF